jgi:hypothetical protein
MGTAANSLRLRTNCIPTMSCESVSAISSGLAQPTYSCSYRYRLLTRAVCGTIRCVWATLTDKNLILGGWNEPMVN